MIDNISKIELLVDEIGDTTEDEIEIYLIGGGAMMYHRYKAVTKDLDLVVMTEQEYGSHQCSKINRVPIRQTQNRHGKNKCVRYTDSRRIQIGCFPT